MRPSRTPSARPGAFPRAASAMGCSAVGDAKRPGQPLAAPGCLASAPGSRLTLLTQPAPPSCLLVFPGPDAAGLDVGHVGGRLDLPHPLRAEGPRGAAELALAEPLVFADAGVDGQVLHRTHP